MEFWAAGGMSLLYGENCGAEAPITHRMMMYEAITLQTADQSAACFPVCRSDHFQVAATSLIKP